MDIFKAKHIHFIGIGGIGTSSIAQILKSKGKIISGSDISPSSLTKSLKLSGIKVSHEHNPSNVSKKHQLIIYSPAIPKNNPELKKAKELKIKAITYPQALGQLTKKHFTIAISGTHGKSTTTALTALVLDKGKKKPSVVIGTKIKQFKNRNYKIGDSDVLVIEACEYKRSFLNLYPDILAITNIEAEHLDYFKNLKDYKQAFKDLIKRVPKNGIIIVNHDDKNSMNILKDQKNRLITINNKEKPTITSQEHKDLINKFDQLKLKPSVPGKFNQTNSAFAATIGLLQDIENNKIEQAVRSFTGTWRRMEIKKKKNYKCTFIDDYGHHPTEIELTLKAIREQNPKATILCIFQPHQYSRTHLLLKELGNSFHEVDKVLIPNIYEVRDTKEDITKVKTDDLVDEINKNAKTKKAINGKSLKESAAYIKKNHKSFDIIVTMGAGNINQIYKLF